MDKKGLQSLRDLINKYGSEDVLKVVQDQISIENEMLYYMKNSNLSSKKCTSSLYRESKNIQQFTNGETSIFYLNQKLINFNLLKTLGTLSIKRSESSKINNYLDLANDLFGTEKIPITLTNDKDYIFHKTKQITEIYSINEYKLLKLLLGDPNIYASLKNPIIYAESENGYAYILGKRQGKQLYF